MSTLPSTRDQARHGLLLLGVPTAPRLLVEIHTALFDGDLSVPSLAALIRDEERSLQRPAAPDPASVPLSLPASMPDPAPESESAAAPEPPDLVCPGLNPDRTAARGTVTLSTWPIASRIVTPATARAEFLATVVRVAGLIAARPGVTGANLLRDLAAQVPGGPEALNVLDPAALAEVARQALADPKLAAAVAAETPAREEAAARAAHLPRHQQLFGVPTVPHQRGGA